MRSAPSFFEQKIWTYFHALDVDHDGRIDAADLHRVADRLVALCSLEPTSPRALAIYDATTELWESLDAAADEHGTGCVSFYDLQGFFRTMRRDIQSWGGKVRGYARNHVLALFETIDHDHRGHIDRRDYGIYLRALGLRGPADELFDALDQDGDGKISLAQLEGYYATWVLSDDPAEVGNRLLCGGPGLDPCDGTDEAIAA